MNWARRHLTSVILMCVIFARSANAQFILSNMQPSDKIAASKYFIVSADRISTFDPADLTRPVGSSTCGTIIVERIQRATAVNDIAVVPGHFELHENFPNPFTMSTKIAFDVPEQSLVTITVYDVLGRERAIVVCSQVSAGRHTVDFTKTDIASGTYFYRLVATDKSGAVSTATKKMILLK
jgi:hypothetical protein